MESPQKTQNTINTTQTSQTDISFDEYIKKLPKDRSLGDELVYHQGFWCWAHLLRPILYLQAHFEAQPTDILIAGMPKTGNTWLKSLIFAIVHRHNQPISESPLLQHNPHELIPIMEFGQAQMDQGPPRLFATHLPYEALPRPMKDSGCRIVYVCRNPLDTFVSLWFFTKSVVEKNFPGHSFPTMEEYFELYLQGLTSYGPFFEHVLGYWKMSIEMPDKVLFLMYEELLENTSSQLKRIAKFIGQPFSLEEEQGGVIQEIVKLCSIKNLKELMVNKEGQYHFIDNRLFFRKGEIGDWANYLTPSMVDRMRELMHQKFDGFNLPFEKNWF